VCDGTVNDVFDPLESSQVSMITAYADETGIVQGDLSVVWGGFLAPDDVWLTFRNSWTRRLAKDGLDHFHMSPFKARRKPFDKLNDAARDSILYDLTQIIIECNLVAVATVVHRPAWDKLVTGENFDIFGDSIRWAFNSSAREFTFARNEIFPDQMLQLVYGEGSLKSHLRIVTEMYDELKKDDSNGLAGIAFSSARKEPGIQAADMLIWEVGDHIKRAVRTGEREIVLGPTPNRMCRNVLKLKLWGPHDATLVANWVMPEAIRNATS
jgi:hypothetical protein